MTVQNLNWPLTAWQAAFGVAANTGPIQGPWDDLTARPVPKYTTGMGSQHELGQAPAGTAELMCRDVDEWLNPGNPGSPWNSGGKSLKPYRRVRHWAAWPLTGNLLTAGNDQWVTPFTPGTLADTAGFEGGTVGTWTATAGCALTNSVTRAHDGSKALLVTWATTGGGSGVADLSTPIPPLRSGTTYTASLWVWIAAGPAVTVWCNGNTATSTTTTGVWQRVTVTFAADSAVAAGLGIYSAGATTAGQQVWVDSVQVELGSPASAFTTAGPTVYPVWAGHIERYPLTWKHSGREGWADLSCVDALAMLPRTALRDVATAEVVADDPDFYWPLWDPATVTAPENLGVSAAAVGPMGPVDSGGGLALDPSTPPLFSTGSGASITSASFTPPVGAVLVVAATGNLPTYGTPSIEVVATSTGGATTDWKTIDAAHSTSGGKANISWAVVTTSAPMTVTLTTNSPSAFGAFCTVWTGADPTTPVTSTGDVACTAGTTPITWLSAVAGSKLVLAYGRTTPGAVPGINGGTVDSSTTSPYTSLLAHQTSVTIHGSNTLTLTSVPASNTPVVWLEVAPYVWPAYSLAAFGASDGPGVDTFTCLDFAPTKAIAGTYWQADWFGRSGTVIGGNNAGHTWEVWFHADTATTWQRRIATVWGSALSEASLTLDPTGVLTYRHLNTGGTLDATVTAPGNLNDATWHHVAVSETSNGTTCTTVLYVDGQAAGTTTRAGVTHAGRGIRLGYDAANSTDAYHGQIARVAVTYTGGALTPSRVMAHWVAGRTGWAGDTPGQRIARAITWGGWKGPTALTGPALGSGRLGPATGLDGKTIADVGQSAASTENGTFIVDPGGNITLNPRSHVYQQTAAVRTFGENAPAEAPYLDSSGAELDPTYIYNQITVTADGGAAQTSFDLTSEADYGLRTLGITTSHEFDADAKSLADYLVANTREPRLRVPTLVINPAANPALWPIALGSKFGDRVTWTRRTTAVTISIDGYIEAVNHDVAPGVWTTTFALASIPAYQAGIVGDPTYGLVGSALVTY